MILLTGASGFLGQHLLQLLCAGGERVRALYNRTKPDTRLFEGFNVEWRQCDLLDVFEVEEVLEGITEVYHCAAIVSFDASRREEILHANSCSTAHLVNAAIEAGVRKMVHVSSVASLGRNSGKKEINEDAEWEEGSMNSVYAQSKQGAEMEVWRGIGEGLNAVIVNPGIILGEPFCATMALCAAEAWDASSVKLIKVVNDEFPFYTTGINGWVDVKDVARAMQQLMSSEISAERFIVSAGNWSYREIFTQMAQALGKKPPYIRANQLMTALVWRASVLKGKLAGKEPAITRETAVSAQTACFYNNEKLLAVIPSFSYTPLSTTIGRMANVFSSSEKK